MDKIGFSYDWSREVRTSNPDFYRWTQWIFLQLFNSWYDKETDKALPIAELITRFDNHGTEGTFAVCGLELAFTPEEWAGYDDARREDILQNYRLAYRAESTVNWCPELGTVLANDEVKDGRSERGGYPVVQKKMMQWSMRITAYAQRLLDGLDTIDWPEPLKESQRNWIGRSEGASIHFDIKDSKEKIVLYSPLEVNLYRILCKHILPNALTPVITFAPFAIIGYISGLVSLDYLGFGLQPPTPSWGELFSQGAENLQYWHLVVFPLIAMGTTLFLITFIGEGIREAFDPKVHSRLR